MKKALVIALALVLVLGAVSLTACGKEKTVIGKCVYGNDWGSYGCMVKVTVKGNKITDVKLLTDEEAIIEAAKNGEVWTAHCTTPTWTEGAHDGDLGYTKAEAAYEQWIKDTFIGKKVKVVNAYKATATAQGQSVDTASAKLAGATQSSARIICAVQDALKKI